MSKFFRCLSLFVVVVVVVVVVLREITSLLVLHPVTTTVTIVVYQGSEGLGAAFSRADGRVAMCSLERDGELFIYFLFNGKASTMFKHQETLEFVFVDGF